MNKSTNLPNLICTKTITKFLFLKLKLKKNILTYKHNSLTQYVQESHEVQPPELTHAEGFVETQLESGVNRRNDSAQSQRDKHNCQIVCN